MDGALLRVAGKEIFRGHQGKGGVRIFGPKLRVFPGGAELGHTGNFREDIRFQLIQGQGRGL